VSNNQNYIAVAVGNQAFQESEPNNTLGNGGGNAWEANDSGIILNSGESAAFSGFLDSFNGYDLLGITTAAGITELSFMVKWTSGFNDINFELYSASDGTSIVYNSTDAGVDSEPIVPYSVTGLTAAQLYYIGVISWLDNNNNLDSIGLPYSILITAP